MSMLYDGLQNLDAEDRKKGRSTVRCAWFVDGGRLIDELSTTREITRLQTVTLRRMAGNGGTQHIYRGSLVEVPETMT